MEDSQVKYNTTWSRSFKGTIFLSIRFEWLILLQKVGDWKRS